MSQRARLLTLLGVSVLLAGALGGYAYYGVFKVDRAADNTKKAELKLFSLERDSIVTMTVVAKGETTTVQRTEGPLFDVVAPLKSAADAGVIAAMINKIATDSVKKIANEKPAKLSDYGLDKPQLKLTATTRDGKEEWLAIGAENKFDNTLFVQTSRSPAVYVADDSLRYPLEKTTFDLREKRLLPLDEKDVVGVSFESSEQKYAFSRSGEEWRVTVPDAAPADAAECGRVASSVRSLRALAIPAESLDDARKYGFDKPRARMVLTLANGSKVDLKVGEVPDDKKGKFYAEAGNGFVAEIADTFIKDVEKPVAQLMDKRLLPGLDRSQVMQLKFSGPENYVVERRPGKAPGEETWQVLSPRSGPGKKWKMDSILQGLTSIKGKAVAEEHPKDLKKYGLDTPVRTIDLFGEGGKELGKVQMGALVADQKDTYYVRTSASQRVYEVEKHNLDGLSQTVEEIEETPPQAQNQAGAATPATPAEPKAP